jgi:hypothetical protein
MKTLQIKPFCYYCEREFDDEATLVQHQKAKHFKCEVCHKKLTTARSLRTHSVQVHKLDLKTVPFAKPERSEIDPDIVGMTGVPEYILEAKVEGRDLDEAVRLQKRSQQTKIDAYTCGMAHSLYNGQPFLSVRQCATNYNIPLSQNNSLCRSYPSGSSVIAPGCIPFGPPATYRTCAGSDSKLSFENLPGPHIPSAPPPRRGAVISSGPTYRDNVRRTKNVGN